MRNRARKVATVVLLAGWFDMTGIRVKYKFYRPNGSTITQAYRVHTYKEFENTGRRLLGELLPDGFVQWDAEPIDGCYNCASCGRLLPNMCLRCPLKDNWLTVYLVSLLIPAAFSLGVLLF